jgi:rhodanese-related sulfurtransferase
MNVKLGKEKMKRIVFILLLAMLSGQFSCTTSATSAEISSADVQEISVARNIDATDFEKFLKEKQSAILVDVRTPQELAGGYIGGAKNININSQQFRTDIAALDKTQPVLVYCRSGRRSAAAMRYMRDNGFAEVYNLSGGIIAWSKAGLPIVK